MLKTKSIESPIDREGDGLRILVARFRGHGVEKTCYDVWMASLGPSEELLHGFRSGEITWAEFSRRYKAEMEESPPCDSSNKTIKNHGQKFTFRLLQALAERGPVTLLCHCAEEEDHCHRHLLKRLIEKV